jgi:hypothetical protein
MNESIQSWIRLGLIVQNRWKRIEISDRQRPGIGMFPPVIGDWVMGLIDRQFGAQSSVLFQKGRFQGKVEDSSFFPIPSHIQYYRGVRVRGFFGFRVRVVWVRVRVSFRLRVRAFYSTDSEYHYHSESVRSEASVSVSDSEAESDAASSTS